MQHRFNHIKFTPQNITTQSCIQVSDALLAISKEHYPVIFNAESICKKLNMRLKTVVKILDHYLAHKLPGPNQNLVFPPLSTQIDFGLRPILKLNSEYCILPKTICAPAVLDVLLSIFRESAKAAKIDFDGELGSVLESFLEEQFNKRGIPTKSGRYNVGKQNEGECDIVLETKTHIIFLEVKKKPLTREGRTGNIQVLVDLSKSLLESQNQAMRHQVELLQEKELTLLDKAGKTHVLQLNDRKLARISVSLQDFGSLQTGLIIRHFLQISYFCTFTAVDSAFNDKIEGLNIIMNKFRNLVSKLAELDPLTKKTHLQLLFL